MFYYIDQPRTLSLPTDLVKTKSDSTVQSVETGLGRWMLRLTVISIDAYPFFLTFSYLTCHLEDMKIGVFCCTVPPDSKKTKLASSDQEASPSAGENTRIVLVSCCAWKCPYSYLRWCGFLWDPCVSFLMTDEFSVRVTKITSRIGVSWTHSLPFCF